MKLPERERDTEIVESVSHAVGEAADDEERHTEQKRKVLFLTGELNGCGHDEAATDTEKSAADGSRADTALKDFLSGSLNLKRSHAGKKRSDEAADDVTQKNHEKLSDFPFIDEARGTCIEFQLITDYSKKAEGEKDCSGKETICFRLDASGKEAETGCPDSYAGKY